MQSNRSDIIDMTLAPVCALLIIVTIAGLVTEYTRKKIPVIEMTDINISAEPMVEPEKDVEIVATVEPENEFCLTNSTHPLLCDEDHAAVCYLGFRS